MTEWKETRLPESKCPVCKKELDAASNATGASPGPGDVSLCIYCGTALIFQEDLSLKSANKAQLAELRKSPTFALYYEAVNQVLVKKSKWGAKK